MDEHDDLALLDKCVDGPLEGVLAVLVLVDAHRHQRVPAAAAAAGVAAVLAHCQG